MYDEATLTETTPLPIAFGLKYIIDDDNGGGGGGGNVVDELIKLPMNRGGDNIDDCDDRC